MIRAEPGGCLPRHRHLGRSEIYIIKGNGAHPQTGSFSPGDFIIEHKGATHEPLFFGEETELLMVSEGPSAFIDDQGNTLYSFDVPMLQQLVASAS